MNEDFDREYDSIQPKIDVINSKKITSLWNECNKVCPRKGNIRKTRDRDRV